VLHPPVDADDGDRASLKSGRLVIVPVIGTVTCVPLPDVESRNNPNFK